MTGPGPGLAPALDRVPGHGQPGGVGREVEQIGDGPRQAHHERGVVGRRESHARGIALGIDYSLFVVTRFREELDGEVVARRHNERELTGDPTAHAEIVAMRRDILRAMKEAPELAAVDDDQDVRQRRRGNHLRQR